MDGHWADVSIDELLSSQLVMAKKASIEDVGGLPVLVNPSEQELTNFSQKLRAGRMFRGLLDPHTGDLFAWDAYEAIHQYVIPKLGLDVKYSDESPFCLYFPPSPLSINDALERQQEVKQGKIPRSSSLKKQAGSLPPQQPITENTNAGTAIMMDDGSIYFSDEPHMVHVKLIKRLGLPVEHIVSGGLIKDGVYYDQGVQSTDTMRYVEQQMAQKRCDEKVEQLKRVREKQVQHKQAGQVIDVQGIRVYKNPTLQQAQNLLKKSKLQEMRGFIYRPTNDLYIWDAFSLIHCTVKQALGIDDKGGFDTMDFTHIADGYNLENIFNRQNQNRTRKQAGSYSSTYTDEQGEQFFNEQHQNDEDQIPYTNFDQRDVSYGYHDSPENTDSGIGWNRDETTSVCLLDQLQTPEERNYPPGMPDYSIVFYEAMPSSDGIEKGNPE
jgi:hypothetical protein